ncbi:DNA topoisomerase II [Pelomyxa schiedti]|nr:DNA topoisomerase II [Pelomyxa schiedti]
MWVFDYENKKMVLKNISYTPGLYKIFDEILVNASDNFQRDPSMSTIKVDIDQEAGTISVFNDGKGIPVEIHQKEKVYIPEMIFGQLLTGSNYRDDVRKVTGGRNGYGAKLANIFSTEFSVETADGSNVYKQTWTENMGQIGTASIKKSSKEYTKVVFKPDFPRFQMSDLDSDTLSLLYKRVYDVAGCNPGKKIYLNGDQIKIKAFPDYVKLYTQESVEQVIYSKSDRWEIGVTLSKEGQFEQVSFVNSICTIRGGTHVNMIADKLATLLRALINKKNKHGVEIKPFQIKANMWLFVRSLIENPAFDSQTKETLITKPVNFGSSPKFDEKFEKSVQKCGLVEKALEWAEAKSAQMLARKGGRQTKRRPKGLAKLDDANQAGRKNALKCTLILTEGDSAKSLAVAGLSVVGRDLYGVLPLRGKVLNVRDSTHKRIAANAEIAAICQAVGLDYRKKYDSNAKSDLRYGHIMIMADQDFDGSHIKGLIINFVHHFWPSLVKTPGFLQEFITPIVKATKGKKEMCFFTMPEFEAWKKSTPQSGWRIKYYKGLGTSTDAEGKRYFKNIDRHRISFSYSGEEDDQAIDLAFSKAKADDRKDWMREFEEGTFLDQDVEEVSYTDFVNRELILYSLDDCERSIPNVLDGFKPAQRKVLYVFFKKRIKKELKVAELSGIVSSNSAYHHGEASLQGTIVNLAQNYVGANNINLLIPSGQFGTRLMGGADQASARYIYTSLSSITRSIFHPDDDAALSYLDEEGKTIEPKWYIPIIPMVLVNGAEGIGTGWSTSIPCYNPRDILSNLRNLIGSQPLNPMNPWYRGWKGKIEYDTTARKTYAYGRWKWKDETTLDITELPVQSWTQNFKELLEKRMGQDGKIEPIVKDYRDYSTHTTVHFEVELLQHMEESDVIKKLKLRSSISLRNLTAFNPDKQITTYGSAEDILKAFFSVRMEMYQKRKDVLAQDLELQWKMLSNKVRFIRCVIAKEVKVTNRRSEELLNQLAEMHFDAFPTTRKRVGAKPEDSDKSETEEEKESRDSAGGSAKASDYDYLLRMPIWSLTVERAKKLEKELQERREQLDKLLATTLDQMYLTDLDNFEKALKIWEEEVEELEKNTTTQVVSGGRRKRAPTKPRVKKPVKDDETPVKAERKPRGRKALKKEPDDSTSKKTPKRGGRRKKEDPETPITEFFKKSEPTTPKIPSEKSSVKTEDANSSMESTSKSVIDRPGSESESSPIKSKNQMEEMHSTRKRRLKSIASDDEKDAKSDSEEDTSTSSKTPTKSSTTTTTTTTTSTPSATTTPKSSSKSRSKTKSPASSSRKPKSKSKSKSRKGSDSGSSSSSSSESGSSSGSDDEEALQSVSSSSDDAGGDDDSDYED